MQACVAAGLGLTRKEQDCHPGPRGVIQLWPRPLRSEAGQLSSKPDPALGQQGQGACRQHQKHQFTDLRVLVTSPEAVASGGPQEAHPASDCTVHAEEETAPTWCCAVTREPNGGPWEAPKPQAWFL